MSLLLKNKDGYVDQNTQFKKVFNDYFNPLVNFVNRYINNWDMSREIVQFTFMKYWENHEKITIQTSVKSYLFQSAKNNTIDYIRKEKNIRKLKETTSQQLKLAEDEVDLDDDAFILRQRILNAMKSLKPKCEEIFRLHKFEGLTYQEISDHLSISKRSVEDNVARAMLILKDELKQYYS